MLRPLQNIGRSSKNQGFSYMSSFARRVKNYKKPVYEPFEQRFPQRSCQKLVFGLAGLDFGRVWPFLPGLLDRFWALLGVPWAFLGASWALLGTFGTLLGISWLVCGAPWPLFGRPGPRFSQVKKKHQARFWRPFGTCVACTCLWHGIQLV